MAPRIQWHHVIRVQRLYFAASRRALSQSHKPIPLRLLPLGGSVTFGSKSTHGNGYRGALHDLLTARGFDVTMVGSRRGGSMAQNANDGWRGFRIDQLVNKARMSVPRCMPDLVTLNAGSNDCRQDYEIGAAGERMETLLRCVWDAAPEATVLLSTLIVNADEAVEARVRRVNEQFVDVARRAEGDGKRCVLVDMHCAEGPRVEELVDGSHPNDEGYDKMARIWCGAICDAHANGRLILQASNP